MDPMEVGDLNMDQWWIALDRAGLRPDPARDPKFFDIGFTEFQADPVAEIRPLYDWLGDELTDETVDRMQAWADNPKDKHGKHEYNGAQFGITDEASRSASAPTGTVCSVPLTVPSESAYPAKSKYCSSNFWPKASEPVAMTSVQTNAW